MRPSLSHFQLKERPSGPAREVLLLHFFRKHQSKTAFKSCRGGGLRNDRAVSPCEWRSRDRHELARRRVTAVYVGKMLGDVQSHTATRHHLQLVNFSLKTVPAFVKNQALFSDKAANHNTPKPFCISR